MGVRGDVHEEFGLADRGERGVERLRGPAQHVGPLLHLPLVERAAVAAGELAGQRRGPAGGGDRVGRVVAQDVAARQARGFGEGAAAEVEGVRAGAGDRPGGEGAPLVGAGEEEPYRGALAGGGRCLRWRSKWARWSPVTSRCCSSAASP